MRVYRWDLDKTYLQTDFESLRGLVRSATESARDKRAVPGATELLRELARERDGWRPRIVLLSGSPTQMRRVLEDKLRMDGVRFDDFTLKDNLRNLRRGRVRAVRDQFGYKLPRLLEGRIGIGPEVRESLFGDDAEADALVYSIYADAVAGRVSPVELSRVLEAAGAYADHVVEALAALRRIPLADVVDRIFIRLDRGVERRAYDALGSRVIPVRTWFEAATVLLAAGEVSVEGWLRVHGTSTLADAEAVKLVEALLERGLVDGDALVDRLSSPERPGMSAEVIRAARASGAPYRLPAPPAVTDWVDVLKSWRKRPRLS